MGRILSVINQKGGVGKTTTAVNMAAVLASENFRVLLLDMDPQCNLSYCTAGSFDHDRTVLELLLRQASAEECIQHLEHYDLIGGSSALSGLSDYLTGSGREYRLREALAPLKAKYDFILIDSPPALSLVTVMALIASDSFIITAQSDIFSMQGIGQLFGTYETVKNYGNPDLKIDGILLTRYSERLRHSKKALDDLEEMAGEIGTVVFRTRIHESVKVREAAALQQDLMRYAPKSRPAADYQEFTKEYLNRIGEQP